jgi:hypothetical protein
MKFHKLLESVIYNSIPIELNKDIYYINNISEYEFNRINDNNLYSLLKPSEIRENVELNSEILKKEKIEYIISSIGIIKFKDVFESSSHHDFIQGEYDPQKKAIVFFKKRNLNLSKKYDDISDLNNSNVGLFIKKENEEKKIICYDIEAFKSQNLELSKKSILFYCIISTGVDLPFGASTIIKVISRKDVNGQQIMYPFAVYFADNSTIISDRAIVSQLAKKVWKDFFSHQNVLYAYAPVDNLKFPFTPQKEDDGRVYSSIKNDLEKIINQKFSGNYKTSLLKILECENRNEIIKLESSLPNDIKELVKNLYDSHEKINPPIIFKFLYDLIINKFKKINLEDIRKSSYLDWAYKINPSAEQRIKGIINNLIDNHSRLDFENKDSYLLKYSDEMWRKMSER